MNQFNCKTHCNFLLVQRKYRVHDSYSLPFVDCWESGPVFPNLKTVIDCTKVASLAAILYLTIYRLDNEAALLCNFVIAQLKVLEEQHSVSQLGFLHRIAP